MNHELDGCEEIREDFSAIMHELISVLVAIFLSKASFCSKTHVENNNVLKR